MQGQGRHEKVNADCRVCRAIQTTLTIALVLAFGALIAILMYYIPRG